MCIQFFCKLVRTLFQFLLDNSSNHIIFSFYRFIVLSWHDISDDDLSHNVLVNNSTTFRQCLITLELQSKTYIYSDDTYKKIFLLVPQFKRLLSKVMGLSTHPKSRQNFTAHLVTTVDISWGLVTRFSEKRRQSNYRFYDCTTLSAGSFNYCIKYFISYFILFEIYY